MKQISLLPSGCQTWHKNVIGSGGQSFVYASTLATYAHSLVDYRLTRLQTAHERTITSVSWCPTNQQQYCTAGADMRVIRWNVGDESEQSSLTLPNIPLMIDWSGHSGIDSSVAILLKTGEVALWDPTSNQAKFGPPIDSLTSSVFSTGLRWNHATGAGGRGAQLAVGRIDGSVLIWDKSRNKIIQRFENLTSKDGVRVGEVVDLSWDPLSNQYLLVGFSSGLLLLLDVDSGIVLQEFIKPTHAATMIAFIPSSPGDFLTINAAAATVTVWNVSQNKSKEVIKVGTDENGKKKNVGLLSIKLINQVVPQSAVAPVAVAAAASSSSSSSNAAAVAAAAAAASSISTLCPPFNNTLPPRFLLAFLDGSVGVWDYTTRHMDFLTISAHSETIFSVAYKYSSPDILATASYDSTIKIWNTSTTPMKCTQLLKGQEGVIYSVSWAPGGEDENRLASSGSEGDIFIWDTSNGQVLLRAKHHSKPAFGLKWNQIDKELLASTSSDGYAIIFNPSGKILRKFKHPAPAYGCDWSGFHKSGLLATGCHDGIVRIFDVSKDSNKPLLELQGHTARAFGVCWSPLLKDRLASGSDDKTIRIWDTSSAGLSNPNSTIILIGHTHNIRALAWSYEVPYILLSGSWDGTIRIWDIRAGGKCIHVITDHHADVYGLASHPSRPFVFTSSSRDTTLRFYSMDEITSPSTLGLARIKMQSIMKNGLLQASHIEGDVTVSGAMKVGSSLKLCGAVSREMSKPAMAQLKDIERYTKLFDYFSNMSGVKELWKLIDAMVNNKPTDAATCSSSLLHVDDVRPVALAAARALHNSKNSAFVGVGRRSDRLAASAATYLSLGHVREFCEINIELGFWDKALAFAPACSMSYWKLLMLRHAYYLSSSIGGDSQAATAYFLASGESDLLIAHQHRCKDSQGAFLSAVSTAVNALPLLPPFEPEEEKAYAALLAQQQQNVSGASSSSSSSSSYVVDDSKIERDPIPLTDAIRAAAESQSALYFSRAQPVLAACALLRINDATGAIQKLVNGGEILLSLACVKVLGLSGTSISDEVHRLVSHFCEEMSLWDEALDCVLALRDPMSSHDLQLLASRYNGPSNLKAEYYLKVGIRSMESFATTAEQLYKERFAAAPAVTIMNNPQAIAQACEILVAFVAAGSTSSGLQIRAISFGIDLLKDLFAQSSWSIEDAQSLLRPLHSLNLDSASLMSASSSSAASTSAATVNELRLQVLIMSYFIGAQIAMNCGQNSIASFLVEAVITLCARLVSSGAVPALAPAMVSSLKLQEASMLQVTDPLRAQNILKDLLAESTLAPKIKAAATIIKKNVDTIHLPTWVAKRGTTIVVPVNPNTIIPAGSNLPTGGSAARSVYSIISRQLIEGPMVNVDLTSADMPPVAGVADGAANLNANYITLAEALTLVKCTPYSPNHSGFRLRLYA